MNNILCEPHHFIGSLKEGEENIIETKELFVDANALVSRCCWRYSEEGLEEKKFLGDFETLTEAVNKLKESYLNLLSNSYHFLEVTKIYHHALKREEDKEERIGNKLEVAYVYLESIQKAL